MTRSAPFDPLPDPLLATTPVGSFGRPAACAELGRDLRDQLRLGTGREDRRLAREVERRGALGMTLLGDHEFLAGLRMRAVEHGGDLLEVVLGEAVELQVLAALDVRLALRDLVGRDPRRGEQLRQVGAGEVLERACVGDLMHATADEQVAGQRAGRRMVDHLVDLELVVARAGLEEEVVRQILDQVPGGEDVVAVPGLAVRVLNQRGGAAGDELLGVAGALHRGECTVLPRVALRCAGEHRVDRARDELDVPELLGGDAGDQVVERARTLAIAEVERLVGVVHEGRHLAELAAQQLLHGGCSDRIRIGRRRQLGLQAIDTQNHESSPR